ncbi:hypothetical protein AB0D59_25955 [Streptomyces sp. NPDC048417]|uniref:hypothetical protein n=1 Tax=Streptomyces sp. NPDC048417 TaxID=3155387 RepID=UPI0034404E1E
MDDATGAESLPGLVHRLRAQGVRRARGETRRGEAETVLPNELLNALEEGEPGACAALGRHVLALLYDDPHQPLPGTGDLLEAP